MKSCFGELLVVLFVLPLVLVFLWKLGITSYMKDAFIMMFQLFTAIFKALIGIIGGDTLTQNVDFIIDSLW